MKSEARCSKVHMQNINLFFLLATVRTSKSFNKSSLKQLVEHHNEGNKKKRGINSVAYAQMNILVPHMTNTVLSR